MLTVEIVRQECATHIKAQDPSIRLVSRGVIQIKGKGSVETCWIKPPHCKVRPLRHVHFSWQNVFHLLKRGLTHFEKEFGVFGDSTPPSDAKQGKPC